MEGRGVYAYRIDRYVAVRVEFSADHFRLHAGFDQIEQPIAQFAVGDIEATLQRCQRPQFFMFRCGRCRLHSQTSNRSMSKTQ